MFSPYRPTDDRTETSDAERHKPHFTESGSEGSLAKGGLSKSALLTTAADLLNGTHNPIEFPSTFSVGMKVRHPQLGLGQVVEAQGSGKWRTVSVAFQSGEPISFVVHKCPLQPVGAG